MFRKKDNKEPLKDQDEAANRIARETMTGDLRDCLLDFLKHDKNPLPWNLQGEQNQRETIEKVEKAVGHAVERVVALIAAKGQQNIHAKLEKISIKDDIQATLIISKQNPDRHAFIDCQGASVLIVVADPTDFAGERAPAEITPDQHVLPVDQGGEDGGDGA